MTARAMKRPKKLKARGLLGLVLALAGILVAGLIAAGLEESVTDRELSSPSQIPGATAGTRTSAVFVSTVDGDTIKTDVGTIRIIGIDTPERGECGYRDAADAVDQVLRAGDPVTLELPEGQRNTDRYGRLLRYVATVDGTDIGLMQLEAGHAAARYDSRDGYPKHPREVDYHAAQLAVLQPDRTVQTTACALGDAGAPSASVPTPAPDVPAAETGSPAAASDAWWTEYRSCAALKRNTVGHPRGPFNRDDPAEAAIYQWFAFGTGFNGDGDGDGLACE